MKKHYGKIIIFIIILICMIWIAVSKIHSYKGKYAEISVCGEKLYKLDINKSQTMKIHGDNNIILEIECKNGSIKVVSSECPDKICVKKGEISMSNENIVCLPAKVIITIR